MSTRPSATIFKGIELRITLAAHVLPHLRTGNQMTAKRWTGMLRRLGHHVQFADKSNGQWMPQTDVLIAIHAYKSVAVVKRFRHAFPERKIAVVLSGTDVYRDLHSNRRKATLQTMTAADVLIALQAETVHALPQDLHERVHVILASAARPGAIPQKLKTVFEVAVSGHLRPEKDPFVALEAAKLLPSDSRIRVVHLGRALSVSMRRQAERGMRDCARYRWVGDKPHGEARRRVARSRLLVNGSKMEGAPNVVFEALASDVPILASHIPGHVGVLGQTFAGYFPVGDATMLARCMLRAETDSQCYRRLVTECRRIGRKYSAENEIRSWKKVLNKLRSKPTMR